jgi:hypothetical protein
MTHSNVRHEKRSTARGDVNTQPSSAMGVPRNYLSNGANTYTRGNGCGTSTKNDTGGISVGNVGTGRNFSGKNDEATRATGSPARILERVVS